MPAKNYIVDRTSLITPFKESIVQEGNSCKFGFDVNYVKEQKGNKVRVNAITYFRKKKALSFLYSYYILTVHC